MTLTLSPEAEAFLQQEMNSGRWLDPSEAITTAILALRDCRSYRDEPAAQRELIGKKLDESFAAAARGDSISSEEFLSGLDRWKATLS
jgi:Arc/MetJ-type ribon-helix-helix transcriptional regulator